MLQRYRHEIYWGVLFTLAMLIWMLVERLVGLHSTYIAHHPMYTNFFALVAILIYVLALGQKREKYYHGNMSWKEGFYSGFIITLVVAILSPLAQLLIHSLISPHFFTNAATHAIESGHMQPAEAGAYFNLGNYIISAFFGALIMGVVTSAIVAFFVRTRGARKHRDSE
ncbi:DUF4199 domain-containing protein [Aliidiomarina sp. Khilg15.8]